MVAAWTVGSLAIDQAGAVELAEDGHDAAGAVDVFHMDIVLGRRHLAEHRHLAARGVDVVHGEVDAAFIGGGKEMQDGVGRAAHGDVEAMAFSRRPRWRWSAAAPFRLLLVVASGRRRRSGDRPRRKGGAHRCVPWSDWAHPVMSTRWHSRRGHTAVCPIGIKLRGDGVTTGTRSGMVRVTNPRRSREEVPACPVSHRSPRRSTPY